MTCPIKQFTKIVLKSTNINTVPLGQQYPPKSISHQCDYAHSKEGHLYPYTGNEHQPVARHRKYCGKATSLVQASACSKRQFLPIQHSTMNRHSLLTCISQNFASVSRKFNFTLVLAYRGKRGKRVYTGGGVCVCVCEVVHTGTSFPSKGKQWTLEQEHT